MSRELSLDRLRTFAAVLELGSFSAAARRLNLTQPAVSLQLRQLETRIGVQLVDRLGRRAFATPAGQALLEHARRLAAESASALLAMRRYREGSLGRVRIGTGATACTYLLPSAFRRLRERHPGLEIIVVTGNTGEIVAAVEDNQLDLALVTLPVTRPAIAVTPVCDDPLVAILPPTEEEGLPPRLGARALDRFPLILYERGGAMRADIDAWLRRGGVEPRPVMEMGNIEAIKQLVAAGLGVSIISQVAAGEHRAASTIAVRELRPRLARKLGLIRRHDKPFDGLSGHVFKEVARLGR